MSTNHTQWTEPKHASADEHKHASKQYIFGYLLSLLLTAISFCMALIAHVPLGPAIVILVVLAGFQILVQLFFFMHITEGSGPPFHSVFLLLGLIFTFAIALMSVWIMAFPIFNWQVS